MSKKIKASTPEWLNGKKLMAAYERPHWLLIEAGRQNDYVAEMARYSGNAGKEYATEIARRFNEHPALEAENQRLQQRVRDNVKVLEQVLASCPVRKVGEPPYQAVADSIRESVALLTPNHPYAKELTTERGRLQQRVTELETALKNMLAMFDRGLTGEMIGRKTCDAARESLNQVNS